MNKKILICDDEEIERAALRDILKAEPSWEVFDSVDGQETLDRLCDGFRPDLCLLDLRMPRLDGLQLVQRIRRDPLLRELRVVVTSSNRDKDSIVALAKLKISGYLLKPYTSEKTLATLRPLLVTKEANPLLRSKNLLAKTLLLVEDDPAVRTTFLEIMKSEAGWDVVEAHNSQNALDRLHSGLRPDMTLIDLQMPQMDGKTLLQRIRNDSELRSLRAIVTSKNQDLEELRELSKLGIAGFLAKPFDAVKVRAALGAPAPAVTAEPFGLDKREAGTP